VDKIGALEDQSVDQHLAVRCCRQLRTLTQGRRPLKIWVFIANITDEFILGLDILPAYDASVDLGHQILGLREE
jgi:hypothetical protein